MNIIKNRYLYFLISLLVIIPGLFFMGLNWAQSKTSPLQLGIDFRGGSLLEVQFEGERPSTADVAALYKEFSTEEQPLADPVIQSLDEKAVSIRSKTMTDETKGQIVAEMESRFGSKVTLQNFTSVSASVGGEVTRAAGWAILFALASPAVKKLPPAYKAGPPPCPSS
jgi:preprotein translocase subunit SecF